MRSLAVLDLGTCAYAEAYDRQRALVEERLKQPDVPDVLVWVEHPEVYTFGRKNTPEAGVVGSESFFIERGGEATFHNPGQLVAYPILRLGPEERDLHRYLRLLETALCRVLEDFNLRGESKPGATGVWVDEGKRKIASIGIAAKSWVTYHGVALNVCNDLTGFGRIAPCGFSPAVMTSLERELGTAPPLEAVRDSFLRHFCQLFERMVREA